jgi:hypothetical protein
MRDGMLKQITDLEGLDREALRERWRSLFGAEPPAYSRDLLLGRLAYRVQELAFGGLSEATREELRTYLPEDQIDTDTATAARMERRRRKHGIPVAGTRLVREWGGRRHEVTVLRDGFEYEGKKYRSLSGIANAITDTRWNGPAFFGLRKPEQKRGA